MDKKDLINPLNYYNSYLKDKVHNATIEYFTNLVKSNEINETENKETCDQYYLKEEEFDNLNDILSSKKGTKTFLIILSVIFIILSLILFIMIGSKTLNDISFHVGLSIVLIVLSIIFILIICFSLNPSIEKYEKEKSEVEKIMNDYKNKAYKQLHKLNYSYDDNCANEIINKCIDVISFDRILSNEKLMKLKEQYNFKENNDINTSTIGLQSGEILGNPFLMYKQINTYMGSQIYTGSIVVPYTVEVRDNEGHTRLETRTEILTASVRKPKPFYSTSTHLVYGNDAAPNLSFSRHPSKVDKTDEKKLEKFVRKYDKKLDKMVEKDIDSGDGSQFTRLSNTEFEALFNALDRDNELEFRLLFTPIAQQNELDLIKNIDGYGDDFSFVKKYKLNYITSTHSQIFDYNCNPKLFIDFDLEKSRTKFISYIDNYLKGFYFDLAPLINIPLYQQTKTKDYIYNNSISSNFTNLVHETIANTFDQDLLKPFNCVTDIINKTSFVSKSGNEDLIKVKSSGYEVFDEVDYIPRMGKDGHIHDVPVSWKRYEAVYSTHKISISDSKMTRKEYYTNNIENNSIIIKKGLLGILEN